MFFKKYFKKGISLELKEDTPIYIRAMIMVIILTPIVILTYFLIS